MEDITKVPFMPKGTKIKYKGDLVCVAARDCFAGDPMSIDDFTWFVEKPILHEEVHPAIQMWNYLRWKQFAEAGVNPLNIKVNR